MNFDGHAMLAYSFVSGTNPGTLGTSLDVTAGYGAIFPATPFNAIVWPQNTFPTLDNAEEVRVTAKTSDTFTITRAQEGTTAKNIQSGWQISNNISPKIFTDLETAVNSVNTNKVDRAGDTMTGALIISNNGGKTTLELNNTGSNTGLTIGTDTTLYRSAPNALRTDGNFFSGAGAAGSHTSAGANLTSNGAITTTRSSVVSVAIYVGVTADTNSRMQISNGGTILWGSGAAIGDTNLYRSAVSVLRTDGGMAFGSSVSAAGSVGASVGAYIDNAGYIKLSRVNNAANVFATGVAADANLRFAITSAGVLNWGDGTLAADTNLYRSAANVLKTDDLFAPVLGLDLSSTTANIISDTATGTQIATSTTQKIGFFAATPVVQQIATIDPAVAISNLGLRVAGTAYPITTSGTVTLSGLLSTAARIQYGLAVRTTSVSAVSTTPEYNFVDATSGALTFTPLATTLTGIPYTIKKTDATANTVTVIGTIDGVTNYVLGTQNKYVKIVTTSTSGVFSIVGNN